MLYRIFDNMTECSELEVARLLPLVSEQRREQALRYTHTFGQYCCLKSYEMLTDLLASTPYPLHSTPRETHFRCLCIGQTFHMITSHLRDDISDGIVHVVGHLAFYL